ncbi:serine/threonine-protein kinase Chk1-like isoform X1 [Rhopilema esculentum]|uniref:serine/threonine-protein kinase Chk1-like isoform X1 n=1 Tax=Rhopilema esculentum TaxID=499914 RepID=UPI0031DEB4A2
MVTQASFWKFRAKACQWPEELRTVEPYLKMAFEPFVEGWDFVETLGEGAYGEVRLAVNRTTQEAIAVKIVNSDKLVGNQDSLKKEVCIHKMLQSTHIVKYYGQRTEGPRIYLFLEYAPGGELFDRIEPDVGMPAPEAHKYFKELIFGLEYIHSKGVTHRDIKPENLLLDVAGNLKITDFGLATVFRYKEKERLLDRCCGTPPYVAPEVLSKKQYKAEPADVFSCGIVLTAMLAGELPWDEPSDRCKEYIDWKENRSYNTPWTKIDTIPLALLKKILQPNSEKRYTIPQIKKDKWFMRSFSTLKSKSPREGLSSCLSSCTPPQCSQGFKRHRSDRDTTPSSKKSRLRISSTQPEPRLRNDTGYNDEEDDDGDRKNEWTNLCFSQPLHVDDLILSQTQSTPGSSQNPIQHLAKRMTRFSVSKSFEEFTKKLLCLFEDFKYNYKTLAHGQFSISTIDRRRNQLSFRINLIDMNRKPLLVDFRHCKGDGIEFKRQFRNLREKLSKYIV